MDPMTVANPLLGVDPLTIVNWCAEAIETGGSGLSEDACLERIRAIESLHAVLAAAQAKEAVAFHRRRIDQDRINGVPAARQGVRAGDEIGFAKKVSPASGRSFLSRSHVLAEELPETMLALSHGDISEAKATIVVNETAVLSPEDKAVVDTEVKDRLEPDGLRRLRARTRAVVMNVEGLAADQRAARAGKKRHVSMTVLPDCMARVSAILPLPLAIAVHDSLNNGADSVFATGEADSRNRDQVKADLFVTRMTGQGSAEAVPAEIELIMTPESLFSDGELPAWLPGMGPIPAATARRFVADNDGDVFLRRLFTSPDSGQLVGLESRNRNFTGLLRRMLVFRDDVCRTPWCDAPIRHADHVTSVAEGGKTSWENASGLCASCNYTKESAGWSHEATAEELTVTTPSGRSYKSTTTPLTRRISVQRSSRRANNRRIEPNARWRVDRSMSWWARYEPRRDAGPTIAASPEHSAVERLFFELVFSDTG